MSFFPPFAGSRGITNTLIGLFGTEAILEFRRERIWHPESDTAQEDDVRQILPVLVVSESSRLSESAAAETSAELTLLMPAANLRGLLEPGVTRILFRRRVWLLRTASPHYVQNEIHLWELKLTEI